MLPSGTGAEEAIVLPLCCVQPIRDPRNIPQPGHLVEWGVELFAEGTSVSGVPSSIISVVAQIKLALVLVTPNPKNHAII